MRVLIVEDDHRLASSLRRNLGETGIVADAVHDGEEGLEAARTTAYDVIVLDVMLPGLDGLEVSRRMREARVHTPILMLTARDSVDDRVRGLESGADDYLVKPFAMREVVARIRALARRQLPQRSGLLRAGKVTLDTGAHVLRVDGLVLVDASDGLAPVAVLGHEARRQRGILGGISLDIRFSRETASDAAQENQANDDSSERRSAPCTRRARRA